MNWKERLNEENEDQTLFVDTDQMEAIVQGACKIMQEFADWRKTVLYFCDHGLHTTCACAGHACLLVLESFLLVLKDFKDVDIPLTPDEDQKEFFKKFFKLEEK